MLPPDTRHPSPSFLIPVCLPGILGGRVAHLPACREPQRHVQTERAGRSSRRLRSAPCRPSQPPARWGRPDLSAPVLLRSSACVFRLTCCQSYCTPCLNHITAPPLLSCGLFSLSSSSFCALPRVVVGPCVPAQGVCKVHFCLSHCVRAHPAPLSAKRPPCQQALPLRSLLQVGAYTHTHTRAWRLLTTHPVVVSRSTPACTLASHSCCFFSRVPMGFHPFYCLSQDAIVIQLSLSSRVECAATSALGHGSRLVWACDRARVDPRMSVLVFLCDKSPM